MALFQDEEVRNRLRNLIFDTFGFYITIDATDMKHFRLRMSGRPPHDSSEECALDRRAVEFHREGVEYEQASDGVKAFTGLMAAVLCAGYKVMLIDEPEAFLHPPLVRKLGRTLTDLASERSANVLAATHSADFLIGCIQAGKKVNVVRMTYKQGVPTARLLPADKLEAMMRDPLLRSAGVLSALFHEGAVICEGGTDRAFYQEVNERLLSDAQRGAENCLFLEAHNKQSAHRILQPLREMGVPAAVVVDLDIIKKDDFKVLLNAASVTEALIVSWGVHKGKVLESFRTKNLTMNEGGISLLEKGDKESAQNLLNNLAEYGIFVVPNGEVESWLKELGATGRMTEWLISMFELMKSDPSAADYVKPREGDVWDFIRNVAAWIENPQRKGMPQ